MQRRDLLLALTLVPLISAAGVNDHVVRPSTVQVQVEAVVPLDTDGRVQTELRLSLHNTLGVELLLRGIDSDAGPVLMQKQYSLFGLRGYSSKSIISIAAGKRFVFDGEPWRLLIDRAADPEQMVFMRLDFGPRGHLDLRGPLSAPEPIRALVEKAE